VQKLKPQFKHQILMFTALLCAFVLDQVSKLWANATLEPHIRHVLLPHLLNLILVKNTGLAFSIVNDNGMLAKLIASAVFIALIIYYSRRYFFKDIQHPLLEQIGVSIIIGAAAGNLIERFMFGHVTDFIEFAFINFPVFNIADILIDVGVGLVFVSIYLSTRHS
jgi:signal peptidase II